MTTLNIPLPNKGLVVDAPAEFIDARSMTETQNMEIQRGVIKKIPGTSAIGSTLSERILRYFELQVGNETRLVRVGLTGVQVLNKSTNVWASVANSALTGTSADTVDYAFPLLSGSKVSCFTNGIDNIRKLSITGNDADLGGSPPKCKYMISFGGYLVLAYIISGSTFYSRVQWCDTGAPETWTGGNSGSVDLLEDPEDITGLALFSNYISVHKANSIYLGQLVTTSDVFRFDRRATGVGTVANATIQQFPSGEQIFLASDGFHLFNGITAPLIESPMQEEIRTSANPQYLYRSTSIFVEELDEYWCAIPIGSQTDPETIYKYNWRTKQMYKDVRTNLTTMGMYLNTNEITWDDAVGTWDSQTERWNSISLASLNPVVIFGDNTGISTKRDTTTNNNNGTAIDGLFETKDFTANDFGISDIDTVMRWIEMEIFAKGDGVTVSYSIDSGTSWSTIGTLTLSDDYPTDSSPAVLYFDVTSTKIRFRFRNNTAAETFYIKKYQLEAVNRERRK